VEDGILCDWTKEISRWNSLAKVTFRVIANELLITVEGVGNSLTKLMRTGKVTRKIDFVEKVLIAVGMDWELREIESMLQE
jgi:hypothetical protein